MIQLNKRKKKKSKLIINATKNIFYFLDCRRVKWVFPHTAREILLRGHGPYMGKNRKKIWMATALCTPWLVSWETNGVLLTREDKYIETKGAQCATKQYKDKLTP